MRPKRVFMQKIELLSPAKDAATGIAAIEHGADAVYIGGPSFGAREKAGNSMTDIEHLCRRAALFDAKVYVTLNTILYDNELETARRIAWQCWDAGVDALIIQDMGLLRLDLPPIALHASTQCHNTTPEKVEFLEKCGFSQVVLARELSIEQIRAIRAKTTVPLEFFIHGALCVSYSGQCYLSHFIGNRSANRGACAQPCRLAWNLIDENNRTLIADKHLLSLKDLNNSANLEELINAGITSFKIEGRLKDIDYVKNITAFYRRRIDEILEREPMKFDFEPNPEKSFSRGFTDYFIHGRQKNIDAPLSPKSMGEYLGTVTATDKNDLIINTDKEIHNGDGLCFVDDDDKLCGFLVNGVMGQRVTPAARQTARPGTTIFRNNDRIWQKKVEQSRGGRRIPIKLLVSDDENGLVMTASSNDNQSIEIKYPTNKLLAENPEKAEENIRRKALQWGDTDFVVTELNLCFSQPLFIQASVIGEMKRIMVQKLTDFLITKHQDNRDKRRPENIDFQYFEKELTYLGNVVNAKARQFYADHGVEKIADGLEKTKPIGEITVMTTKHCVRFANGMCSKVTKMPATPLFIQNENGRFKLVFDCAKCEMRIKALFVDKS